MTKVRSHSSNWSTRQYTERARKSPLPEGALPYSNKIRIAIDQVLATEELYDNGRDMLNSFISFGTEHGFLTEKQLRALGKLHTRLVTKGYSHNSWWN